MSRNLTIGEIAQALHCDERSARKYLKAAVPAIDLYAKDPKQIVQRAAVIELCRLQEGTPAGRRLLRLLGETGDLSRPSKPPRSGRY